MRPGPRRIVRNVVIGGASVGACLGVARAAGLDDPSYAASMATAYVGLGLLALTLLLGPWNVLRRRANPVSTHLRRDVGIWAGVVSLVHVGVGLQRHMGGQWWLYFTFPDLGGRLFGLRYDVFGMANWIGLVATLVLLVLLVVSNDLSLRRLGPPLWKRVQRWNYGLYAAVVAHAFAYQVAVGGRALPWVVAVAVAALVVAIVQGMGFARHREGDGRGV